LAPIIGGVGGTGGKWKKITVMHCKIKDFFVFSHTLQLAVHKALQDKNNIFQSAVDKAKAISAKVSKSVKAKEKLVEFGGLAVKTYSRTRWFSELFLVDSIISNHEKPGDPLAQMLASLDLDELVPTALVRKLVFL
jgi:hypothetical protein